jgi:hypothetical protein
MLVSFDLLGGDPLRGTGIFSTGFSASSTSVSERLH